MKSMQKRGLVLDGSKGFTLIELLVVIAIIGLLASIILVSLGSARNKAKDTRVISDVSQIRTQLESDLNASNGVYADVYAGSASAGIVGLLTTGGGGYANICGAALTGTCVAGSLGADMNNNNGGTNPLINIVSNGVGTALIPSGTAYAIYGKLNAGTYYCVDSGGKTSTGVAYTAGTAVTCP